MSVTWFDPAVTLHVELGLGSGPLAASPSWTAVSSDVRRIKIGRGRSSVHQTFDSGTATITLDNLDGDYDPNNTSSPHSPNLKLGTPFRIRVVYLFTSYDLFRGHITGWPLNYPESGLDAVAVIEATENLSLLRTTRLDQTYSEESTRVRIGAILDDVSWPASDRDLDNSLVRAAGITYTGDARTLLDDTVEAEQGHLFVAGNGDLTFKDRISFSAATSQATFGQGGGELKYREITPLYDDDLLINFAGITASAGDQQIASDSTSISDHGERSYTSSNDSIVTANDALNVAEWVVGKNKDVTVRVTGFVIQPQSDPTNLWPQVIERELTDLVTVKWDPPGAGDTLNQIVAIQSISHIITPATWTTTYSCHPLSTFDTNDYWVLGTSDDLDTNTVLA